MIDFMSVFRMICNDFKVSLILAVSPYLFFFACACVHLCWCWFVKLIFLLGVYMCACVCVCCCDRFFHEQPLMHKEVTDDHLVHWYFEDQLKAKYDEFVQALEVHRLCSQRMGDLGVGRTATHGCGDEFSG